MNNEKLIKLPKQVEEMKSQMENNVQEVNTLKTNKVDKVQGKGLSTNDYDNTEKSEVAKVKDKANITDVNNKVWSMANMGQDVKQAMTGGSVAVVGDNGVLRKNIVNKQVTTSKLANATVVSKNIFNPLEVTHGKWLDWQTGLLKEPLPAYPQSTSDFIQVLSLATYYRNKDGIVVWYDSAYNYISGVNMGNYTVKTVVAPSNACYCRIGLTTSDVDAFMFAKSTEALPYEPYTYKFDGMSVDKNSIPKLQMEDLDLLRVGKNLFDKTKAIKGKYVRYSDGTLVNEHPSYPMYASDFIELDITKEKITRIDNNQMAFYNENKNYISGDMTSKTLTIPVGAKYCRVSVLATDINSYQLEYGTINTEFEEYKVTIPKQYLPDSENNNVGSSDEILAYLPKEIVVLKGRVVEIYNNQVCHCGNLDNFHFQWKGTIGRPFKRKFQIDTNTLSVGNYPITLEIYDNNLKLVNSISTTIKIIQKTSNTNQVKVMCIGDSLTYNSGWRKEIKKLIDTAYGINKVKFIGTLGNEPDYKHEGRAGWTCANYLANSEYVYSSNMILTVTGVINVPVSKKIYIVQDSEGNHEWEVERCELTNGSGKIYFNRKVDGVYRPLSSGTITAKETSTVGDNTIIYTAFEFEKGNPFWNSATGQLDFNNYLTTYGLEKPNVVTIMLGTNDIGDPITCSYSALKSSFATIVTNIKTLVDKIKSQWTDVKILVMLPPYFSNQDGIAKTYPMHKSRNLYVKLHLMIYTLTELLVNQFDNYDTNVKVVPICQTHDSDNNFGKVEVSVNPRLTSVKEIIPVEATHPQIEGEYQMADTICGAIVSCD